MIEDLAYRQAHQAKHPIARRNGYLLSTTMLEVARKLIFTWVELGKSGLAFAGSSRAGKSTALRAISAALRDAFPDLLFVDFSSETQTPTDRYERLFTQFMEQLAKGSSLRRRTQDCHALANCLMSMCRDSGAAHCVVLLDEAQRLGVHQWEALSILWNRLEMNNFGLCIFSFGSEELRHKSKLIQDGAGSQGVAGRIFVKVFDFDGLRSRDELKQLLEQFDEKLQFPDAQWPFTRYFAQAAYDGGWRLASEADSYWQALCTHSCIDNLGNGRGICMEWVVDPIHYVLKDCLNNPQCIPGTTPLNWAKGLELLCPKKIY